MERVFTPISASGNTCFTFFKYGKIYSGKTERLILNVFLMMKMILTQQLTQLQQIVKMVHVVGQVLRYEMENAFQHMRV